MLTLPAAPLTGRHVRISFMDGLVLAIAADEKTVTRRLFNPQPTEPILWYPSADDKRGLAYDGEAHFRRGAAKDFARWHPGDILDVCEALEPLPSTCVGDQPRIRYAHYRSDEAVALCDRSPKLWTWKVRVLPARYCPAWAIRHHRRIVSVRPERLSAVTDAEAVREGIARLGWEPTREGFLRGFRTLHELADDADPWVWRIEWASGEFVDATPTPKEPTP